MKKVLMIIILVFIAQSSFGQQFTDLYGDYLGQNPPGDTPVVFAQGIISTEYLSHSSPTFSPDGNEVYWWLNRPPKIRGENWLTPMMMTMRRVGDNWITPEAVSYIGAPFFSPDGKRLYFDSSQPITGGKNNGFCYIEKVENSWSEPKCVDLIARFPELQSIRNTIITRSGNLYFMAYLEGPMNNSGIYRSELINGVYAKPEPLTSSCTSQTKKGQEINKEFTDVSMIDISTISGNCNVIRNNSQDIKVNLVYNYIPSETFEPVFTQDGNKLVLKENMTGSNSGNSDWTLMVPEQIDIEFSSASGYFKIKNISGKMKVNTASGNIEALGIKILDNAEFSSASGKVNISFAESPRFDVLVSSASGEATLDFNQNPVIGNIEMQTRIEIGKINCPFKFDNEREEIFSDQKYLIKSVTLEKNAPSIKIHTASGIATLKK